MRTIRKGNDISINWSVFRNEKEESFEFKTVNVYLCDKHGCTMPFEYTINGNVIQGVFYGKDQVALGTYSLVLVENEGLEDMVTLDYVDCFLLASKLKNTTTSGQDKDETMVTEVVSVQSTIDTTTSGIDLSKYALKENVYSKDEADSKYQPIGDYAVQDKTYTKEEVEQIVATMQLTIDALQSQLTELSGVNALY